jgi:DNA-binding response OmpR family regulator
MILIVDDRPENILSLRRTLELAGFEVDGAGSGEEALRKILKTDYSLIILDVQMPGMDGFEVAETLKGINKMKDVPIIFLSAVSTEKKFITMGYEAGAVDYVIKPIDPDLFILRVQTLIRLYEQNRELNSIRRTLLKEVSVRRKAEKELCVWRSCALRCIPFPI